MTEKDAFTKGALTRQDILDAAERLVLSQGYHGTSMRQIAHEAGIAVGGIYNHFSGKQAIFETLLERHQPYSDIVTGVADLSGEDAAEAVEAAARIVISKLTQDPVFIRLAFIDLQEFGGDTLFKFAMQLIQGMLTFFSRLAASGQLRQDIPLPVMVRSFAGVIGFYGLSEIVISGAEWARAQLPFEGEIDWIGDMMDLFLSGVLAEEEP